MKLKPQGPCSLEEMRDVILKGQVGPYDLVLNDDVGEWKMACQWSVFEPTLFPAVQGRSPDQEFLEDEKEWVLLSPDEQGQSFLQEGPFSVRELRGWLKNKKISSQQYIWKSGLSGWCRIQDRPEFS